MKVPELRSRVVSLLRGFHTTDVRERWFELQAALWECEPSEVLSLLAAERPLPEQPFALVPVLPAGQTRADLWEVMDSTLLTSRPVWLLGSNAPASRHQSWPELIEALCGLLDELGGTIPPIAMGEHPDEWGPRAVAGLLVEAIARATGDRTATAIGCAIVWKVLGFRSDASTLPVPRAIHDPIDGWHRMLEILTSAQSAAATVLMVLAVEGGGREVRSLSLTKEG